MVSAGSQHGQHACHSDRSHVVCTRTWPVDYRAPTRDRALRSGERTTSRVRSFRPHSAIDTQGRGLDTIDSRVEVVALARYTSRVHAISYSHRTFYELIVGCDLFEIFHTQLVDLFSG